MPKLKEGTAKQVALTIYLPLELKERLQEKASTNYSNASTVVKNLILNYLKGE